MSSVNEMLESMDYKNVLKYFTEISAVPRGSYNNQGISDYIVNFAKEHGLRYVQDEALNVIIYKDATKGYENHEPVIIQGHMDMVCVKAEDVSHDFTKEGIELLVDGDYLHANKTTLGGDDGIAVAFGLALLADNTISHPALEVLITTDEETGMDGAKALDPSLLKGKYMINVDSEDEGTVLVGCAGGLRLYGELPLKRIEESGVEATITIGGLKGGHSGAEIHHYRTNATLLLARVLMKLKEEFQFSLVSMFGGTKDNAIPSYAEAKLVLSMEQKNELIDCIGKLEEMYKKELEGEEPNLYIKGSLGNETKAMVLHPTSFEKMLFLLIQAPNGVQVMSSNVEGLVESSLNLGIFEVQEENAVFHFSIRSSVSSYKDYLRDKLIYLFDFLGAHSDANSEYPAWEYQKESPFRDMVSKVFEKEYGYEPKLLAIHAGLECGIISEKIPGIEIVSIGPDMKDIHTPKERLSISSSIRVYKFVEKLLEEMK
ncbi:aminoacyl-histidine dipeptidase [Clostridium sp. Marseille-P299]|uniref:aminoacyl-histidine dipeptidase n=1 Tax=Clostridium sp. Marseille-P299 TaxID=1805477 RepID=UPI0008344831|nr:aminoacyl-histidine dipeptidase [Clostridium sp. Marseille-P299]